MLEHDDVQAVQKLNEAFRVITGQLGRVIVGQHQVIEELLIAMFARGHCLLVGVPGLAKTLMIRTLADALSLEFSRIQFTPDLMPSDITGTEVIQEDKLSGTRELRFLKGPIFANVLLADEINRTPPKTQAALLEAMQEHQLTVGGKRHQLTEPFFVLATQNPIEQEGTYPLPEAQLDRFMFNTFVDYPDEDEELEIVKRTTADTAVEVAPTLNAAEILHLQRIVRRVPIADHIAALRAATCAAHAAEQGPGRRFRAELRQLGAGPRQPIPGLGREGPGRAPGAVLRGLRRHPCGGLPRFAAPHHDELQRRGRRGEARRHHPPIDRNDSRGRRGPRPWKTPRSI